MNMPLTFNSATSGQCVNVSTNFNADSMEDKQFTMSLSSDVPSSSVSLSPSTTNITIENSMSLIVNPYGVYVHIHSVNAYTCSSMHVHGSKCKYHFM